MKNYLKVETIDGIHIYAPNEWEDWDMGPNFFVIIRGHNIKDMYALKNVMSVLQSENGSDFH